ncbi:hypothetical protein AVEN_194815-1 [Araneus ventricosus]|uniref:RNase H type-1 domain-containing protein n=1 Tax=Araneus ventricosus TaxID=182803 RepID=A0A4Y2B517_ARAVE|nr:hypothetical protein AVEN_194815-1 [Araneus ventricosus]
MIIFHSEANETKLPQLNLPVALSKSAKPNTSPYILPGSAPINHSQYWIPSHVNIQANEIADAFAKAGADDASVPSAPLTYLELFSRAKSRNKTIWLIAPEHHWYQGSRPGGCLSIDCSRHDQTTLTCFLSGHIRSLTFSDNSKCFEICPKCTAEQATPDPILACLGLSKQDLVSNPLLTLDFFRLHGLMDLI